MTTREISILALGDSYTIGEAVNRDLSYPFQLANALTSLRYPVQKPEVIAKTGWTTADLLDAIALSPPEKITYDLVLLLIGVNNQYQRKPLDLYEKEFSKLCSISLRFTGEKNHKVLVLSIPDYAFTPFGQAKDPAKISEEINSYNEINKAISLSYRFNYLDITDITRKGLSDPELLAEDGLHPSGKMYQNWLEKILPVASHSLGNCEK